QTILDQAITLLNHGEITARGANGMLKAASGVVDRVTIVETPQAVDLLVQFLWTASDINAALGDLAKAYDSAKSARNLVERFYAADLNDPKVLMLLMNSTWRMADAIADRGLDAADQRQALSE